MTGLEQFSHETTEVRIGELSRGETETGITSVVKGVKPFQECHAADKVHPRP